MDSKQILSVGIDIGTSTSQLVFSRLELRNRAAACQIPRFEITDRRIVWQSPVAFTPLTDVDTLDEAALDALIRGWYAEAGVRPEDVETGAVIVTGESLKTVNARRTASGILSWPRRVRIWNPSLRDGARVRRRFPRRGAVRS